MIPLVYELRLTSPAVLTRDGEDANTVTTWPFVPGRAVLGALAGRFLSSHQVQDAANDERFRRLFLSGQTRFLHAYPAPQGKRLLPAPRSLFRSKSADSTEAYERGLGYPCVLDIDPQTGRHDPHFADDAAWERELDLVRLDLGFVQPESDKLSHYVPSTRLHMHHQRDRAQGRPSADQGSIFHYESLQAGERFVGAIELDECEEAEADKALLTELLAQGPLSLGRSRGAEYGGQAEIELRRVQTWSEVERLPDAAVPSSLLMVTLLSEYVGRDRNSGALTPGAFEAELRDSVRAQGGELGCLLRSFVQRQTLSGYVAAWRMPQPTISVLAAGSVFVFQMERPFPAGMPLVLVLGERRAEGCGRAALNWPGPLTQPSDGAPVDVQREGLQLLLPPKPTTVDDTTTLAGLKSRMLEQWLVDRIPTYVTKEVRFSRLPRPTVLGAVRSLTSGMPAWMGLESTALSTAIRAGLGDKIIQQIQETKIIKSSPDKPQESLLDWLRDTMGAAAKRLDELQYGDKAPRFLENHTLPEDARKRVCAAFLDAVLDQARRRAAEQD